MPHVHEKIDFVVTAYIVHKDKILLIHHKKLNRWLPVGGHIELDEDPEDALFREVKEESGLDVEVLSERPPTKTATNKPLFRPHFMDIHHFGDSEHRHTNLIYFARAKTDKVKLADREHNEIRWFSKSELENADVHPNIVFYSTEALKAAKQ